MIIIDCTFSEVTPESAENGELSDSGFVWKDNECSFRDLIRIMQYHTNASCYPATGGTHEWYTSEMGIIDYRTGTERETSINYSRRNPERNAKYWRKAAIYCGIVKQ